MDKANFKVQVYAMRSGQRKLATLPAAERNRMLLAISQALKENSQRIFKANQMIWCVLERKPLPVL